MTPKIFLRFGGIFLIILGLLGLSGLLGQISTASFFHPPYWINFFHFGWGITIFSISFTNYKKIHNLLTLIATIIATTIGLLGLLLGGYFADRYNLPELKDPSDHIAHIIVGLTALWAWHKRKS